MRNLQDIFNCYFAEPRRSFVLATLFSVEGSHVYRPGALLALAENGATFGSISAGCLEDDIRLHGAKLFDSGGSRMIHYCADEVSDKVLGFGLGCGGSVRVLLERLPDERESSHLHCLKQTLEYADSCTSIVWGPIGQLQSPSLPARVVVANGEVRYNTASEAASDAVAEASKMSAVKLGHAEIGSSPRNMFERTTNSDGLLVMHKAQPRLHVFGGGEIGLALQFLTEYIGWNVTIVESKNALEYLKCKSRDCEFAALLTHNDDLELSLLRALLPSDLTYVGLLGSRSRIESVRNALSRIHPEWDSELWDKLHAPVGLDLGANSAQEIALSIVAEIVATTNGKSGGKLRGAVTTIHQRQLELVKSRL